MPIVSLGSADLTPACSYTLVYNVLHFPAGVVPVTTVRGDEQVREVCQPWRPVVVRLDLACSLLLCRRSLLFTTPLQSYKSADGQQDMFTKTAQAVCEGSEGLPVGVQVAALPKGAAVEIEIVAHF